MTWQTSTCDSVIGEVEKSYLCCFVLFCTGTCTCSELLNPVSVILKYTNLDITSWFNCIILKLSTRNFECSISELLNNLLSALNVDYQRFFFFDTDLLKYCPYWYFRCELSLVLFRFSDFLIKMLENSPNIFDSDAPTFINQWLTCNAFICHMRTSHFDKSRDIEHAIVYVSKFRACCDRKWKYIHVQYRFFIRDTCENEHYAHFNA